MPAPTMSHVICTAAIIVLIFVMQFFYLYVVNNVQAEMAKRELKEIADYVSDTLANLYFLVNSTSSDITLEKNLDLPLVISDSVYIVKIQSDATGYAQSVYTYLKGKSVQYATAWLLPGLMVDQVYHEVESSDREVVAGCGRQDMNVYVWIKET